MSSARPRRTATVAAAAAVAVVGVVVGAAPYAAADGQTVTTVTLSMPAAGPVGSPTRQSPVGAGAA